MAQSQYYHAEKANQPKFDLVSSIRFFKTDQITLVLNVGSFRGERPRVCLSKYYHNALTGKWHRLEKSFFMDIAGLISLRNITEKIGENDDSLLFGVYWP